MALTSSRTKDGKKVTDSRLLKLVPGPDFPTDAKIIGSDGAKKYTLQAMVVLSSVSSLS